MNNETVKEIVLPLLAWVLGIIAITAVMTVLWVHNFATECAEDGGTYSRDGGTVYCNY